LCRKRWEVRHGTTGKNKGSSTGQSGQPFTSGQAKKKKKKKTDASNTGKKKKKDAEKQNDSGGKNQTLKRRKLPFKEAGKRRAKRGNS